MVTAVCKTCDAPIWRTNSGYTWYSSSRFSHRRSTTAARCAANGGKHVAQRGSVVKLASSKMVP